MSDPAYALQVAQSAAILADAASVALVGDRVFDELDVAGGLGPASPYVLIGADQVLDDSNGCSDGWQVVSSIHVFAAGADGRLVAKQVVGAIKAPLRVIAPDGYVVSDDPRMDVVHAVDADGATAHSTLTITYDVTPA